MNDIDWKQLKTSAHIRSIVLQYSKIKGAFVNERRIEEHVDNPVVVYGIERIKEELIELKTKLEKYNKTSGLDKF